MSRVAVGYVHNEYVTHEFMTSLYFGKDYFEPAAFFEEHSGPLISRARNRIVRRFLEQQHLTHLLFVDTDVRFNIYTIQKLVEADLPIIGAKVYAHSPKGRYLVVLLAEMNVFYRRLSDQEEIDVAGMTEPFPIAGMGMACTVIKREVLEALMEAGRGELWPFAEVEENYQAYGEDITFCKRAAALGFQTYVHPAVEAEHIKPWTV